MTYGYARVSTTGQNLARQMDGLHAAGITDAQIFADKMSGKDFERPEWQSLIRKAKAGDLIVVTSLDRFGRNYDEMRETWHDLVKRRGVNIKVLDMPILDTTQSGGLTREFIGDLVLSVLSYVAAQERENIRKRQAEGIAAAKARGVRFGRPVVLTASQARGVRFGRKPKVLPDSFIDDLAEIRKGNATIRGTAAKYGCSRTTVWRCVKFGVEFVKEDA